MRKLVAITLLILTALNPVRSSDLTFENVWDHDLDFIVSNIVYAINERCYALLRDRVWQSDGIGGSNQIERYWVKPIEVTGYEPAYSDDLIEIDYQFGGTIHTGLVAGFEYEQGSEPDGWFWALPTGVEVRPDSLGYVAMNRPTLFRPVSNQFVRPAWRRSIVGTNSFAVRLDYRAEIANRLADLSRNGYFARPASPPESLLNQAGDPLYTWRVHPPAHYIYFVEYDEIGEPVWSKSPPSGTHADYQPHSDGGAGSGIVSFDWDNQAWETHTDDLPYRLPSATYADYLCSNTIGRAQIWTNEYVFDEPVSQMVQGWRVGAFDVLLATQTVAGIEVLTKHYGLTNSVDGVRPFPYSGWDNTNSAAMTLTNLLPAFEVRFAPGSNWTVSVTNNDEVIITDHQEVLLSVSNYLLGDERWQMGSTQWSDGFARHAGHYSLGELSRDQYWLWANHGSTTNALDAVQDHLRYRLIAYALTQTVDQVSGVPAVGFSGVGATRTRWISALSTNVVIDLAEFQTNSMAFVVTGFQLVDVIRADTNHYRQVLSREQPARWPDFPWDAHWTIYKSPNPDIVSAAHSGWPSSAAPVWDRDWLVNVWIMLDSMRVSRMSSMGLIPDRTFVSGSTTQRYAALTKRHFETVTTGSGSLPPSWVNTSAVTTQVTHHVTSAPSVDYVSAAAMMDVPGISLWLWDGWARGEFKSDASWTEQSDEGNTVHDYSIEQATARWTEGDIAFVAWKSTNSVGTLDVLEMLRYNVQPPINLGVLDHDIFIYWYEQPVSRKGTHPNPCTVISDGYFVEESHYFQAINESAAVVVSQPGTLGSDRVLVEFDIAQWPDGQNLVVHDRRTEMPAVSFAYDHPTLGTQTANCSRVRYNVAQGGYRVGGQIIYEGVWTWDFDHPQLPADDE